MCLIRINYGKRVFIGPIGLELLGGEGVEVDGYARLFQFMEDLRVEIAPDLKLVDLFTDGVHLHCVVGVAHKHTAG